VAITPDEFYARVQQACDAARRLPLSRMTGWEILPFEPDGLQVVRFARPQLPEPSPITISATCRTAWHQSWAG
jgi:hypothetical protein